MNIEINYYDEIMAQMLADDMRETFKKLILNSTYPPITIPNPRNVGGSTPIPIKKPVLKVETLSKSHKIKGVRYKRKICFTPYIVQPNQSKEEMIARADEVEQFIKDSCLRGYIGGGRTYTFECKKDAALAYLRFA